VAAAAAAAAPFELKLKDSPVKAAKPAKVAEAEESSGSNKKKLRGPEEVAHYGLQAVRINLLQTADSATLGGKQLIQASGHEKSFNRLSEGMLVKKTNASEQATYEALVGSSLERFAPRCYRSVDRGTHCLLYLEDLNAAYGKACVMDVKMGTRTFEEKVAKSNDPKPRPDMNLKLLKMEDEGDLPRGKVYGELLTSDEVGEGKGVTKLRYHQLRDELSTSTTKGFRIEGIQRGPMPEGGYYVSKTIQTEAQLHSTISDYVQGSAAVANELSTSLRELRVALEASAWFKKHELVSSSLLFVYDGATPPRAPAGVWMIDFAHCTPLDVLLDHRSAWQLGNREDGYLLGLDSLLATKEALPAAMSHRRAAE